MRRLIVLVCAGAALAVGAPSSTFAAESSRHATKDEEQMVADLVLAINSVRAAHSLRPLRVSPSLVRAADQHNREMGRLGYFSHNSANGADFSTRIERYYGSGGSRYWSAGENLLWTARDLTAQAMVNVWMHSPPHRANLLSRSFRQFGLCAEHYASAPGYFGHRRIWLVTLDFGVRY